MPKCQVWGCDVNIGKGIPSHRFPQSKKHLEQARRWLVACKIEFGDINKVNFKNRVICGRHFAPDAYEEEKMLKLLNTEMPEHTFRKFSKKKLKHGAMPTLFMPHSASGSLVAVGNVRQSTVRRMDKQREIEERMERKRFLESIEGQASGPSQSEQPSPSKQSCPSTSKFVEILEFSEVPPPDQPSIVYQIPPDQLSTESQIPPPDQPSTLPQIPPPDQPSTVPQIPPTDQPSTLPEVQPPDQSSEVLVVQPQDHTPAVSEFQPITPGQSLVAPEASADRQLDVNYQHQYEQTECSVTSHNESSQELQSTSTKHRKRDSTAARTTAWKREQPTSLRNVHDSISDPKSMVNCSSATCECGCQLQFSKSMMSIGTQTHISGEPEIIKLDHHYYFLTPMKNRPIDKPNQPIELDQTEIDQHQEETATVPTAEIHHQQIQPDSAMYPIRGTPKNLEPKKLFDSNLPVSSSSSSNDSDSDYEESDESSDSSNSDEDVPALLEDPIKMKKLIVFENKIRELLTMTRCSVCNQVLLLPEKGQPLGRYKGTALNVSLNCILGHEFKWSTQPVVGQGSGQIPAGNLQMSSAILFSGATFTRMKRIAELLHLQFISESTFYEHQQTYLFPTVHDTWARHQDQVIEDILLRGELQLSGDGRCDSPGYCAKYCTYVTMDMATDMIVDVETINVIECSSSNAMEKEGCRRVLDRLQEKGAQIKIFCTDRHMGIQKMMKDKYKNIQHQFDVWHLAKNVAKRLTAKAKKRDAEELMPWVSAVKNHLWWSASTCNGDEVDLLERWQSVTYHTADEHDWDEGQSFYECEHEDLDDEEEEETKWLERDTPAHQALNDVVKDKRLTEGIKKLNLFCHTGNLENFNSMLTKYCPKRIGFGHEGMVVRSKLAALDNNNNVGRQQAVVKKPTATSAAAGSGRYNKVFTKAGKKWIARPIYEQKSYLYVDAMMDDVLKRKREGKLGTTNFVLPELAKNIAPKDIEEPTKEEAVANRLIHSRHLKPME